MSLRRLACLPALACAIFMLAACSPTYNWREVHGDKLQFSVLMPAKAASFSRNIDLDGIAVEMTMTAAEVDGVTFAVGAAELPDAARAPQALAAMRTALLNNIGGKVQEAGIPGQAGSAGPHIDLVASGVARGRPARLMARLLASDKRIYQVLIMGGEKDIAADHAETFFTSFKPG